MYRQKDLETIKNNINEIENKALDIFIKNHNDPTIKEYNDVINILKKFFKKNNLIVYGGYAQNDLILKKNKNDGFYSEIDMPDYEIYSPDPIKHAMEIADILYDKKYFNPKVDSAVHEGTYKIYCNLVNYSDISYLPKKIFDNMPTIKIDGIRMTHPHYMMTDAYRVYSDLLTSGFRLSKTFFRMTKLFDYYPLDDNAEYNIIEYNVSKKIEEIKEFIRKKIIHHSKLIVIGHYAFNYYVKKTKLSKYEIKSFPYYQLITTDYQNDVKKIYNILKKQYSDIKIKEYYPFVSWWDRRIEFSYKNQVILKLYSNNKRCVPFKTSDKKFTLFGTIQTLIYFMLIDYNYAIVTKNNESYNYLGMLVKLFKARDSYLNEFDLSVLDDSPFKEFTLNCYGKPVETLREATIDAIKRVKSGGSFKLFSYLPRGNKGKVPNFKFEEIGGNEIKDKKQLTKLK